METKVVYIDNNEVMATLGVIDTNHSMTTETALEILGLGDDESLNQFFAQLGWDGYDYNCIDFMDEEEKIK